MANLTPFVVLALAIAIMALTNLPAHGQLQTGCTSTMLTSFTPCMNFVANSTGNGVSPTPGCCNSLKSLMSNGTDCLCLIATGNIPFQIPINRTLAISLPRACNMPGVPLQCKSSAAPVPAPGPTAFSPTPSTEAAAPLSPKASAEQPSPASSTLAPPAADSTPVLTPPSPTTASDTPTTTNSGSRPVLTPSAAGISLQYSPSLTFAVIAAMLLKNYY